jgi:small subunit ribosomal protein S5
MATSIKRFMIRVPLLDTTFHERSGGQYGSGRVLLRPAAKGNGVSLARRSRHHGRTLGFTTLWTMCLGSTNNPTC